MIATQNLDLLPLVAKWVEINKGDVRRQGLLTGQVRHWFPEDRANASKWIVAGVDEELNDTDFRFDADDGWTVKEIEVAEAG